MITLGSERVKQTNTTLEGPEPDQYAFQMTFINDLATTTDKKKVGSDKTLTPGLLTPY